MRCYIGAGWFTQSQEAARKIILNELKKSGLDYYSPKDHGIFKSGMNPEDIFQENIKQIQSCDFMIASTEGKDMGTLFECGCAYTSKKPLVYFWYNGNLI